MLEPEGVASTVGTRGRGPDPVSVPWALWASMSPGNQGWGGLAFLPWMGIVPKSGPPLGHEGQLTWGR